jgi:chitinase domain-containing protein 1
MKYRQGKKPVLKSVGERGLVNTEPQSYSEITKNHKKYSRNHVDKKMFKGDLLGFVTPWNSHGYDVAKTFGAKFNYISPGKVASIPTPKLLIMIDL